MNTQRWRLYFRRLNWRKNVSSTDTFENVFPVSARQTRNAAAAFRRTQYKIQLDTENPERKQDKKIIGFFFSLFSSFLLDRHGSMNEQLRLSVCPRPLHI